MQETKTHRGETTERGSERPEWTLRILFSAGAVTMSPRLVLRPGELVLGRETNQPELAALRNDPALSRAHARLDVDGRGVTLVDTGSRNGTFLDGQRVHEQRLGDGALIRVGGSLLLLRHEIADSPDTALPALQGRSAAMRQLRSFVQLVAPTEATVLLLGESGVGKSHLAAAIHERSGRRGPFVSVNCGAIPAALAESQLFGHTAGAFTGAERAHAGFFRAADGGTLFLDEIGELPLALQVKLLGVLESRAVTPVGAVTPIPCDVRLLAATNVDLSRAVATGAFRGDLYARVSELPLTLPPLRARREDILLHFTSALGDSSLRLSVELAEALVQYAWPFNVRELQKVALEAKIRGQGQPELALSLVASRLTKPPIADEPAPAAASLARGPIPTREELLALVEAKNGVISDIAEAVGRSRRQIYRWLEEYGLDVERYRR